MWRNSQGFPGSEKWCSSFLRSCPSSLPRAQWEGLHYFLLSFLKTLLWRQSLLQETFLQAPNSQAHPNSQAQTPQEAETSVLSTLPSGGLSLEPAYSLSGHRPVNLTVLLTKLSNTQNSFLACDSFVWLLLLKTYKIFYLSKMSTVLLKLMFLCYSCLDPHFIMHSGLCVLPVPFLALPAVSAEWCISLSPCLECVQWNK